MGAIRKIIDHSWHEVVVALPEHYRSRKLEVIVLMVEDEQDKKYDYSKFYGTLDWRGDAVAEQRKLRDEWE